MDLVNIVTSIILGGTASSYVTEFLKLSFVKIPAERYPRVTAAVLSIASSVIALIANGLTFKSDFGTESVLVVGTFVVSAFVYNQAIKGLKSNTKATAVKK